MAEVALFHSVLGVRQGVRDLQVALEGAGHTVLVVDQYGGTVFDDYAEASGYAESIGFPALMREAIEAVTALDDGFIVAGFSNGAGMAEYVATQRRVAGVVLISGALPLEILDVERWPAGVPVQLHAATSDPFRNDEWLRRFAEQVAADGTVELVEYPIAGHLFSDSSLITEFDPTASSEMVERILQFCDAVERQPSA